MNKPLFNKILIANRGEIACRIIRTVRRLGIKSVAIFSDADKDALHVQMADEAFHVGAPPALQSYLNIDRIVQICRDASVDAVHPGYGFLSEREKFVLALEAAGITFIGPNAHAISAMGDKIESKRVAANAGVSVVPGFLGLIDGPDHAVTIADEIGYPVMIKASAGGGGKGMRVADSAADVAEHFARARSEAAASFGDDRMFIEKFITNPRHIEIQVLGDRHGNVVHLGERECSIQRRNQKVLEEAPSAFLDEETRLRMGSEAVSLAKAVGYDSAGTVEFVVGQDRSFFFLEMNTRLQVEHPVTEIVTGVDLVEEMIRSAAGQPLRRRQEDITLTGWAVESRICAEEPERGFLPSSGPLTVFAPPQEATASSIVRVDTGVREGDTISVFYDPLIAKLITSGATRAEAIEAQTLALDAFAIEGIRTNLGFLSHLMRHPRWGEGALSTGFIAEEYGSRFKPPTPSPDAMRRLAAIAVSIDLARTARWMPRDGAAPAVTSAKRVVQMADCALEATVDLTADGCLINVEGEDLPIEAKWRPGQPLWVGTVGKTVLVVHVVVSGDLIRLSHAGSEVEARVYNPMQAQLAARMPLRDHSGNAGTLTSPSPGVLVAWAVSAGQSFSEGDPLCVIEAMKMEMTLRAEQPGVVERINADPGDSLSIGALLMTFSKS